MSGAKLSSALGSPLQERCLLKIINSGSSLHTQSVANKVGVSRIAAASALRALEEKGLVGRYPGQDRWSGLNWYATAKAKLLTANTPRQESPLGSGRNPSN